MACVDQAQAVGGACEGIEQAIGLHARQAEYSVDAVAQQTVNDRFSAGHAWHGLILALVVTGTLAWQDRREKSRGGQRSGIGRGASRDGALGDHVVVSAEH